MDLSFPEWDETPRKDAAYFMANGFSHMLARLDYETMQVTLTPPGKDRIWSGYQYESIEEAKQFVEEYYRSL